jgi:HlyD family secretion protein
MTKAVRVLTWLLGLAALAGALSGCGSAKGEVSPTEIEFAAAKRGELVSSVSAVGSVRAGSEVGLSFDGTGRISQVLVEAGEVVEQGQALAQLDTANVDLQERSAGAALAVAQAQLDQLKAGPQAADVAAARGQVAAAQAALDQAIAQRDQLLAGATEAQIAAAQAAVQSATANYNEVKAGPTAEELALAKAALDKAEAALVQAQAAYDRVRGRPDVGALPESVALQNATIDVQQAQASYDALVEHPTAAELAAASATLAQAKAQLAQLEAGVEPQKRVAEAAVAAASAQRDIAQAQLDRLMAGASPSELAAAQARVEQAQVAVDSARLALDRAILEAPVPGTVARVDAEVGEYAGPQQPAVTLFGTGQFSIEADVDEADIGWIGIGQDVQITFDAFPGTAVAGKVVGIAPQANVDVGVVSYLVTIATDPTTLPLRAGMTANTEIVRDRRDGALLVPNQAIVLDPASGQKYVARKTATGVERVEITTGLTTDVYSEVLTGLEEDDQVVVSSSSARDQLQQIMESQFTGGGSP